MKESPIKQCLILIVGMLILAIPLSALTWLRPDKFEEQTIEPTPQETFTLDCYLEVYSTENLTNFQLYYGEELLASKEAVTAHDSVDFDFTLPTNQLTDAVFHVTAVGPDQKVSTALLLRLEPEGLKSLETTLWSRESFDYHFTF